MIFRTVLRRAVSGGAALGFTFFCSPTLRSAAVRVAVTMFGHMLRTRVVVTIVIAIMVMMCSVIRVPADFLGLSGGHIAITPTCLLAMVGALTMSVMVFVFIF